MFVAALAEGIESIHQGEFAESGDARPPQSQERPE
jgi:hypothetical protein